MPWLPVTFVVIPLAVYLASWSGWFATSTGYDRDYAQLHGVHIPVISPLYSLFEYHVQAIQFGMGLSRRTRTSRSRGTGWLVTRPVAFFYECYTGPVAGPAHYCPKGYTGAEWSQEVLAIGTPAIWWGSMLALLFCLGWWLLHRDWRAGAVLCGVLAGWAPWFPLVSRTKFYYYALEFEPFLILSIVLCLGLILGPATASALRRSTGARHRRRLRAVRAADVLVLLFDPGRSGHPLPRLVQPHVVPDRPRLDLRGRSGFPCPPRLGRPFSRRFWWSLQPTLSVPSAGFGIMVLSLATSQGATQRRDFRNRGDVSGPVVRLYKVR